MDRVRLTPAVRRRLYLTAAALAPVAVLYGLLTENEAALWLNVLFTALFGVAAANTPQPSELDAYRARHAGPTE
jgi:hypothetical protein